MIMGMPNVQIFRNGQPVNMNTITKTSTNNKNYNNKLEKSYNGINISFTNRKVDNDK